jgi:nucleotide-binding universal stress UspA family protein
VNDLPDPATAGVRRVLLASEGRAIPKRAVEYAARFRAPVHVFSVARVWGTSLGLPNPGLLPSKREWDEQRKLVTTAVKALRRRGIEADGHVLGTRKATKRIVGEAERLGCDAIVMAADPPRGRLVADFLWSQEPYRVRRRAKIPVYLVLTE